MRRLWLVACLALSALAAPAGAAGLFEWPVPGPVILGYGERYASGAGVSVHTGCDVAAPAGAEVRAPCEAAVSFVGEVPAGAGAKRLAITLTLDDGRRITVSPLASVAVEAGSRVCPGSALGTLAGSGDISSPASHLHVSLRDSAGYADPATLFVGSPAVAAGAGGPPSAPPDRAKPDEAGPDPVRPDAVAAAPAPLAVDASSGSRSGVPVAPPVTPESVPALAPRLGTKGVPSSGEVGGVVRDAGAPVASGAPSGGAVELGGWPVWAVVVSLAACAAWMVTRRPECPAA